MQLLQKIYLLLLLQFHLWKNQEEGEDFALTIES